MEYNTTREHLVIREYGRYIQNMVDHLLTVEDRDARQRQANGIVELMAFFNPQLKSIEDYRQKLWDHLFVMADFELDVDSPYPKPTRESVAARPDPLPYPKRKPRFTHLGKNLELVIDKALSEEDTEKRLGYGNAIAFFMKLAYNNWHRDPVQDDAIKQELTQITQGQLDFDGRTPYVKAYRPEQDRDPNGFGAVGTGKKYKYGKQRGNNDRGGNVGGGNNSGGKRKFKKKW